MKKEVTILLSVIVALVFILTLRTVYILTLWSELSRVLQAIIIMSIIFVTGIFSLYYFRKEIMAYYICLTTLILSVLYLIFFIIGHYYKRGNFIVYSNDNSKTIALYNKWGIKLIPSDYGEIWHYYQLDENNKKGEEKYLAIVGEHLDSIVGKEGFVQYHIYDKDFHLRSRLHFLFVELSSDNSIDRYKELKKKITPEDIIMLTQYHYNHENGVRWYDYHNWDKINDTFDDSEKTEEEDIKDKQADKEYLEIGQIDAFWKKKNEDTIVSYVPALSVITLYVKSFDGDKFYYIGIDGVQKKYLVKRTKDVPVYNAYADYDGEKLYFDNPAWSNSSQPSSQHQSNSQNTSASQSEPQRVIVEHHRDPQPVQEWVPCTGCNGSGKCFNCNGTGQNLYSTNYMSCVGCGGSGRCEFCAGHGGHYETRFR